MQLELDHTNHRGDPVFTEERKCVDGGALRVRIMDRDHCIFSAVIVGDAEFSIVTLRVNTNALIELEPKCS
jgi:hypothetical protein